MAKDTTYTFYSRSENMMIGAEELQPEKRTVDGRITRDSGLIQFTHGFYETTDVKVAAHIRSTNSFKIGKIREVSEEEKIGLLNMKQARVKAIMTGDESAMQNISAMTPMEAAARFQPKDA